MPLERCTSNGKEGWRFGKSGKCYTGPGAKAKATAQGKAIKATQNQKSSLQNDVECPGCGYYLDNCRC